VYLCRAIKIGRITFIEKQDAKIQNAARLLLASGMSANDIQTALGIKIE